MKLNTFLLASVFLLVLAATTTGIFYQTAEPDFQAASVRGGTVTYQGSGIYRYNPVALAREGVVWDVVNLFIALPLFLVASVFALRGSLRATLLVGGLLAYLWYVYLSCAMMYAFNNLFLLYVAIVALSSVALIRFLSRSDIGALSRRFANRFPRRLFIAYSVAVGGLLIILWTGRILPIMRTGVFPKEFAGLNTLGSQVLDLGVLVPLAFGTAALLHRRSPWGFYLASVTITVGFMMSVAIPAWIVVPLVQDGEVRLFEAIPFFLVSILGIALAASFYSRMERRPVSE